MSVIESQKYTRASITTAAERWAWCELIADSVERYRALQQEEKELEARLKEKRTQKEQTQAEALSSLENALESPGQ